MRIRVLSSVLLALAGGAAILKGGFLLFVPIDSGGGFVGEGGFYSGALLLIGASMLAIALMAWCLAFLVVRPMLSTSSVPNGLIAAASSTVVASPFLVLYFRSKEPMSLAVFALLWVVLFPALWGSVALSSRRSRRIRDRVSP